MQNALTNLSRDTVFLDLMGFKRKVKSCDLEYETI